jgi:hypothetical protein
LFLQAISAPVLPAEPGMRAADKTLIAFHDQNKLRGNGNGLSIARQHQWSVKKQAKSDLTIQRGWKTVNRKKGTVNDFQER